MRFHKIYVEIGNVCNLRCSFCPTLKREKRQMSPDEFRSVCKAIRPYTDYIYLHLMGEPLCHPHLEEMLAIAKEFGFQICITTNGTLLDQKGSILKDYADSIHKISVSLHCIEGNDIEHRLTAYMDSVVRAAKELSSLGVYTVMRLWNLSTEDRVGQNVQNEYIQERLHDAFVDDWKQRWNGYTLADRVFLEYAGIFTWPDESEVEPRDKGTCRGLGDQIGILADGTVVPCCLDSEGNIALGNIFEEKLADILESERAKRIVEGFAAGEMVEPLCRKCSFARRFSK